MPTLVRSIRTATAPRNNSRNAVSVNRDALTRVVSLAIDSLASMLDCTAQESEIRSIFEEARSLRSFAENHGIGKNLTTSVRRSPNAFIFDDSNWCATTYMNIDTL